MKSVLPSRKFAGIRSEMQRGRGLFLLSWNLISPTCSSTWSLSFHVRALFCPLWPPDSTRETQTSRQTNLQSYIHTMLPARSSAIIERDIFVLLPHTGNIPIQLTSRLVFRTPTIETIATIITIFLHFVFHLFPCPFFLSFISFLLRFFFYILKQSSTNAISEVYLTILFSVLSMFSKFDSVNILWEA